MKIHFQASQAPNAQKAFKKFVKIYGQTKSAAKAKVIVAIGGDGQALVSLQDAIRFDVPMFGINYGKVGSLLNPRREKKDFKNLPERIKTAEEIELYPLRYKAKFIKGKKIKGFAINEVNVCNHDRSKSVYLNVDLEKKPYIEWLGGDGLIIASPAGSSAYNRAAGGKVLSLDDFAVAMTPNNASVKFSKTNFASDYFSTQEDLCTRNKFARTVFADSISVGVMRDPYHTGDLYVDDRRIGKDCRKVKISLDETPYRLLFDPGLIQEKVKRMQFSAPKVA